MKLSKSFIGLIIVSLVFYLYATNSFSIFQRDSALEIVDFSIENSPVNNDIPSNPTEILTMVICTFIQSIHLMPIFLV